jgi:hypothetical protein
MTKMCTFSLLCISLNFCSVCSVVYGLGWSCVQSRATEQRYQILAVKPLESAGQKLVAMASDTGREKRLMKALDLEPILCTAAICQASGLTAFRSFFQGKRQ